MSLPLRQQRFAEEYVSNDGHGTLAAQAAGYSEKTAYQQASRLLKNAKVRAYIDSLRSKQQKRTNITADAVLNRFWAIATADPNDLIEYRRICCPSCHGGGIVDPAIPPDPKCTSCNGDGVGVPFPKDTRRVTGPARLLYAGLKVTKNGLEVKMHDQQAALLTVAKLIGMMVDKKEISGPDGAPIQHGHSGNITVEHKLSEDLESLTDAFVSAANREKKSDLCADDIEEPVDTGLHQNGDDEETN